jgi:hypothetical protein
MCGDVRDEALVLVFSPPVIRIGYVGLWHVVVMKFQGMCHKVAYVRIEGT